MQVNTNIVVITAAEKVAIRAAVAGHGEHAVKQVEWFIDACERQDDDWQQYAANPDLVAALGGQTADRFLGWA